MRCSPHPFSLLQRLQLTATAVTLRSSNYEHPVSACASLDPKPSAVWTVLQVTGAGVDATTNDKQHADANAMTAAATGSDVTAAADTTDLADKGDVNGAAGGAGAAGGKLQEGDRNGSGGTAAKAFKRVVDEEWLGHKGAWDNSYEATFGAAGWGAKASATLQMVRT